MTDLILWRHAEAEALSATGKDADRRLTARGRQDAAAMAQWLDGHLPADTMVWCSPAQRCRETVDPYTALRQRNALIMDDLQVVSPVSKIYTALQHYHGTQALLVVGHEPNLGRLINTLTHRQTASCAVSKGEVWWLRPVNAEAYERKFEITLVQSPGGRILPQ